MFRSYVKGALSYVLPAARNSHSDLFSVSAEFSYSQFLRHLVLRSALDAPRFGERVAEFGPGSSLGFGLAALISGASHYQFYDVTAHFDAATNVRIFDELVALFRARTPIPFEGEFVRMFPYVDDHAFPEVLNDERLERALAPDRLARIRSDILLGGGETITNKIGLSRTTVDQQADWIASHSVLEHVDDLDGVYELLANLLAPGGVMTHLIDFSSHGLTDEWNGHWALGDVKWTILRGRRTYLINREPLQTHMRLLCRQGLTAVDAKLHRRVDGVLKERFASPFQAMTSFDASTHMAFLVCRSMSDGQARV